MKLTFKTGIEVNIHKFTMCRNINLQYGTVGWFLFLAYITGMLFQRTGSQWLLSLNGNKVCFKVIKSKTYRPQRTEQLKCKSCLVNAEKF